MSDSVTMPEGSTQDPEQFSASEGPAAPEVETSTGEGVSPVPAPPSEPAAVTGRRRPLEDSEQNMVGSCVIVILISLFAVFFVGVNGVTPRGELVIVFFGMLGIGAAGAIVNVLTQSRL